MARWSVLEMNNAEWTQDPPEDGRAYRYWWPTTEPDREYPGQFLWEQNQPRHIHQPFAGNWEDAVAVGMHRSVASDGPRQGDWPSNYFFRFPEHARKAFAVGSELPASLRETIGEEARPSAQSRPPSRAEGGLRCPRCSSGRFEDTGFGHGSSAGSPPGIDKVQIHCLECDHRWHVPAGLVRPVPPRMPR